MVLINKWDYFQPAGDSSINKRNNGNVSVGCNNRLSGASNFQRPIITCLNDSKDQHQHQSAQQHQQSQNHNYNMNHMLQSQNQQQQQQQHQVTLISLHLSRDSNRSSIISLIS